ncbi:MAG: DNA replication and repair protein RecF, partial [Verrucomicrobiales bacterium]|nr:DNA replication and repair protein RecF [Verrucomicrobiales bacterium]
GGRELWLDGEPVERAGEYLAASGLVVWMGNDDLELVKGPGEVRRRYLDFLAAQVFPEYRVALRGYEKALRSRNRLLKDYRVNWGQVDAYTAVLVRHGEVVVRCRRELVGELSPVAAGAHAEIGGNGETLGVAYVPGADGELGQVLEAARPADERRRQTTVGPHRDDFEVLVNGMGAGKYASEGQQRTVALALKLAQARELEARKERVPLLLLDDIFGELDPGRRNLLLGALPAGSQKLVTTTHLDWAESGVSPEVVYSVSAGRVSRGD